MSSSPSLDETCLDSQEVYRGHFLEVRRDTVRLPDGQTAHREYIRHPGAVMIVPLLDDGRLVLERQYRYPMGRVMIEFPAGKIDAGEPGWQCAVRELAEETGYRAREWAQAGVLHNAIAYSDEGIEIWFARGLTLGERALDNGEFVEVFAATPEELDAWVRDGRVTDVKTMVALMWLQNWRAGRWPLQWRADPADAGAKGG
ncbi:NUDIX domain-containing protein [Caldimonas tepidiphila]|uniref:NUDIX domain-containing protein n=1 Tax=Caldimonas tepidiphila TaxID=2315841 RepID=UPI000E5A421F|nr:NUDIX hydrolase [Caldimonas tepidiphila]